MIIRLTRLAKKAGTCIKQQPRGVHQRRNQAAAATAAAAAATGTTLCSMLHLPVPVLLSHYLRKARISHAGHRRDATTLLPLALSLSLPLP